MKYLILGDGKFGTELHHQTGWDYISRKKDGIDFTNIVTYKYRLIDYDVIINCIGYTKTYENERKLNWDVNYLGVIDLVNFCNLVDKKLVHLSTDYVYANSTRGRTEEAIPVHFESWYAYTKLLADGYIQAVSKNYLMLRTSFKPRPFPWKTAWGDILTNADYIDIIAIKIRQLIEQDAKGIYNVGTELKTYYDLACRTVEDCVEDNTGAFGHPHNVEMNLTKLINEL